MSYISKQRAILKIKGVQEYGIKDLVSLQVPLIEKLYSLTN